MSDLERPAGASVPGTGETGAKAPRVAPVELHDDEGCIMAVRADRLSRGKVRAFFTSEWGVDFTEGQATKTSYRFDEDWEREQRDDGVTEPYDGWPMWECRASDSGAVDYWKYDLAADPEPTGTGREPKADASKPEHSAGADRQEDGP